jgi:parvulin-like peptidyl-prolyl isomerase
MFRREEDALAFEEQYRADGDFDRIARRFIEEGRAAGEIDGEQYVKLKDLRPQIAQAAIDMEAGSVSSIFSSSGEFLLFRLADTRFYEDAGVEEEARQRVLEPLQREKADEYIDSLIAEHATIDRRLLDEIDLERETTGYLWSREERPVDFAKLLADQRVLATVKGEEPYTVTVGDLAAVVKERHFHSIETAAEGRKLNREKWPVLRDMLLKRAAVLEAARLGRDQSDEYLESMGEYTSSLLFEAFIKKVVAPDVAIGEDEVREYHREHVEDFSSPAMYRMHGLAFDAERDAQAALDKLRRGADARWVSANSPGQVDKESEAASLFDGALLSLTAMPDELHQAAERARQGDALLYSSPEGYHYVVTIDKVFPAKAQPYEAARGPIAQILFQVKLEELIDEWSEKLKEAYETRIFVTGFGH